jgi:tRNA U34 5-methylaminomethyl-2-thiouridine-forming methyltransferase MnmC
MEIDFRFACMKREMIITADQSHSVMISGTNVTYHSRYGAIRESRHVYIESGLAELLNTKPLIHIFEMGFGTGLNALLAYIAAASCDKYIYYETIDELPLEKEIYEKLNYCEQLKRPDLNLLFQQMQEILWQKAIRITPFFTLKKCRASFQDYEFQKNFDIIFYDAFGPGAQPELWTKEVFTKLFSALSPGGLLLTYCSKGDVRRAMEAAGLRVHKLPGPPGKREILKGVREK